jgi:hypothetical protein
MNIYVAETADNSCLPICWKLSVSFECEILTAATRNLQRCDADYSLQIWTRIFPISVLDIASPAHSLRPPSCDRPISKCSFHITLKVVTASKCSLPCSPPKRRDFHISRVCHYSAGWKHGPCNNNPCSNTLYILVQNNIHHWTGFKTWPLIPGIGVWQQNVFKSIYLQESGAWEALTQDGLEDLIWKTQYITYNKPRRLKKGDIWNYSFFNPWDEWGWVTPHRFTPGKDPVPNVGWAPGPVCTGAENLAPTGIRSPHSLARSK